MNLLTVVQRGFDALKIGKSLLHVEAWKNAQAITSLLAALVAVLRACGVDFGIDDSVLTAIGVGIAALVNSYLTIATSKKVGMGSAENGSNAGEPRNENPPSIPTKINPASKPSAGFNSHLFGDRLHDGRTPSMERRGESIVENLPASDGKLLRFREFNDGWNNRWF
jgi:hypothetical protein